MEFQSLILNTTHELSYFLFPLHRISIYTLPTGRKLVYLLHRISIVNSQLHASINTSKYVVSSGSFGVFKTFARLIFQKSAKSLQRVVNLILDFIQLKQWSDGFADYESTDI